MSGIEVTVAGLVLGALPFFISAAKHHRTLVAAYKKKRLYTLFILELETQQSLLDCYLKSILGGTDLADDLQQKLLLDRTGKEWSRPEVKRELENRLGSTTESFVNTLERMIDILLAQVESDSTLHLKLESGVLRLQRLCAQPGIAERLWERLLFGWRDPNRNQTIKDIKDCNDKILKLKDAAAGTALYDKKREVRRAHTAYRVCQDAQRLFEVLSASCTCQNRMPHAAHLRMMTRKNAPESSMDIYFDVLMHQPKNVMCEMSIRVFRQRNIVGLSARDPNDPSMRTAAENWKRLEDICEAIRLAHAAHLRVEWAIDHAANLREVRSSPGDASGDRHDLLNLEDCLSRLARYSTHRRLYKEKYVLCVILAHSLIQLHQSQWLAEVGNMKDIMLIDSASMLDIDSSFGCLLRKPYVSTSLHLPGRPTKNREAESRRHLTALGVILIELFLNRSIAESIQDIEDPRGILLDILYDSYNNMAMKDNYFQAVQFCICPTPDPESRTIDFSERGFRELYYQKVIVRMEDNLLDQFEIEDSFWDSL